MINKNEADFRKDIKQRDIMHLGPHVSVILFYRSNCYSAIGRKFCVMQVMNCLTQWGWETHICVSDLNIIGSDNGLSPSRRQATIWTIAGILLTGPLRTNFNEILFQIRKLSFKKMHLKLCSAKWRPSCLGLNVLVHTRFDKLEVVGNVRQSI